jgi:hypothetical protein
MMRKESLVKLVDVIEDIGYVLQSLETQDFGKVVIKLGPPVLLNEHGEAVDPKTGKVLLFH